MEVDQPMHPLKKRKLMRDSLDKREQMEVSQTNINGQTQAFSGAPSVPPTSAVNPTLPPQMPPPNVNNTTPINIQLQAGGNESELSMNSKEENYDDEEFDEEDDEENQALMQGDYNIHVATEYKSEEVDEDVPYYTDNEIDELWTRLTDENKSILIKQLLRKHPEDVKDLYKLADNDTNVLGFIKQEFKIIEDNLAAAIRIDYDKFIEADLKDTAKREKYKNDISSRSDNHFLDEVVKEGLGFFWKLLDTCREYFHTGKIASGILIFNQVIELFAASAITKQGYANAAEETEVSNRLIKTVTRYLETEARDSVNKELLNNIEENFAENFSDESVRNKFVKNFKNLRKELNF
jgi:hypothetical protein